ncbi:MAG: restriction endonuclease subunit S [Candidatus Accumulibacter sp.]|nr:restriction endonuclease subunit S [Accumulibacter sp.]
MIPADWACARISEFARLESGHTPSKRVPKYWGGSVQWVSLHDTRSLDVGEIRTTAKTITEDGLNNSSARLLPVGTVVFSRTATVGKTTVLASPMATSQDFANYVCGPNLHNRYLVYLFRSMGRTWRSLMAGSIHNTIYMPVFKELRIVLPPVSEQRVIADALSDVDALLAGLERLIAKKRDLKQAAMQQLLTGQTRLPGFQGEWDSLPLASVVVDLDAGVSVNSVAGASCSSSGDPGILKTSCVADGTFDPDENKLIDPHDIDRARLSPRRNTLIISRMNTPNLVGAVGFVEKDYPDLFLPDRLWMTRFRPDSGVHPKWLAYLMSSPSAKSAIKDLASGTSGSMKNIAKRDLLALSLDFPPTDEQEAIATVLSDMDAELSLLTARRDKTRALKQAMMQELLTGRTRLL